MKQIKKIVGLSTSIMLVLPFLASAQQNFDPSGGAFGDLLNNILVFTNTILIPFILGIGFLVFVWGMFQYFIAGGANEEKKESGKSLMIYATLGFVLIIIFWGIVNLLTTSTGLSGDTLDNVPTVNTI
jgi:heme/copper-type cytochrome/quinol oxidase subunit 2